MFIAGLLIARGERPVFLTRGYGGRTPGRHGSMIAPGAAQLYGDEPLLLAGIAPTLVARDRRAGIIAIETRGREPSVVIMDDGLQNAAVAKDLSIALVDGKRGIGNGEVIPAGPLRAPLEFQIGLVDAIVVRDPPNTADERSVHAVLQAGLSRPVLAAHVAAAGDTAWIARKPLVAFAGIANPQRFYKLLERLGGKLVERVSFPDHHAFARADAERLIALAQAGGAQLVTTDKDFARLGGDAALRRARGASAHAADRNEVRRSRLRASQLADRSGAAGHVAAAPAAAAALEPFVSREPVAHLQIALHRDLGRRVRLLQLDAPIAQIGQHDRLAGHRAAHEVARREHLKLPVKELHLRLAPQAEESVDPIHARLLPMSADHNANRARRVKRPRGVRR